MWPLLCVVPARFPMLALARFALFRGVAALRFSGVVDNATVGAVGLTGLARLRRLAGVVSHLPVLRHAGVAAAAVLLDRGNLRLVGLWHGEVLSVKRWEP